MKKLRFFDSLKFVRFVVAAIVCTFILNVAHADTPNCASYIDYTSATGTVTQNGTPSLTNPITPQFYTQGKMVLRAVGNVADSYDAETGKITRRVGVVILDGTESWGLINQLTTEQYNVFSSAGLARKMDAKAVNRSPLCTHFIGRINQDAINTAGQMTFNSLEAYSTTVYVSVSKSDFPDASDFKAWVAAQYASGNPVVVYYQLKTPVEEDWPSRQCELIKIATTKYNEQQFAPVQNELSNAMNVVDDVVSRTMSQAQQIDQIATSKQTRPNESCPPFKKCLLVEGEDGTPHWYEIYDPINDFLNPILAAAGLSGNQGAPIMTTHTENGKTIYDTANIFFNGSGAFRKKYIDSNQGAADRPFGPATGQDELPRCADNATRTTNVAYAGICYDTGGMFRTLTEGADDDAGEWAIVYNDNEGGASLGITPGVVYGIAKCTSVGQHVTEITGDEQSGSEYWWPEKLMGYTGGGTTLANLITEYPNSNIETVFNTLPSEYGTDEKPGYPRDNFQNCWCKMTAIGVPGSGENDDQRYANGSIMSVSGDWVFDVANSSAGTCANLCASNCAYYVRANAAFRRNVLTVR